VGMKDMGKVMGIVNKELAGQADGKTISNIVKAKLS
ncbi:GatB/YqeY domain-containing protein, partial [uncultured Winogradskyella sp.]